MDQRFSINQRLFKKKKNSFTNFQHSHTKTNVRVFFLLKFASALLPADGSHFPASGRRLSKGRESVTISERESRDNNDTYEYWCVFAVNKDSYSLGPCQCRTTGDFLLTVTHQCGTVRPRDDGWSVIWTPWHHTCEHVCGLPRRSALHISHPGDRLRGA